MNAQSVDIVAAWLEAARDLGVDVIAPFAMIVGGRKRSYDALVFVPHFGGGMLVSPMPSDQELRDATAHTGYRCSFVNGQLYGSYNRELFVETLSEWGFTGPDERRPEWILG